MTTIESRLERLENEVRFRIWIRYQRMIEHFTLDELEAVASTGQWPDRPEPAPGMSSLDKMDRASLIKLWKEDQQKFEGRNREQMLFFAIHGHWPEQGCGTECQESELNSKGKQENTNEAIWLSHQR